MKYEQDPAHGFEIDARETMYPSRLTVLRGEHSRLEHGTKEGTIFGYVFGGVARVKTRTLDCVLHAGAFFSAPGGMVAELNQRDSFIVAIERFGYRGMELFGQTEKVGRMSYIDGCSDSLLVFPNRLGDANLNYLHFPPGINQTQHIHPSIRFGIVAGGKGEAWYQGATFVDQHGTDHKLKEGWTKPLQPGGVFLLEEQEQHSFRTYGEFMDVIAFHPDSDWGPQDTTHPMINRTYIDHGKR